jgi:uncharacterized membrane protein
MLTGSYHKRLEADLTRWVGEGLVSPASATTIRQSLTREGGFRLPGLLGMFGGLLIASSVAAFVAANWEDMPRLLKLGMILAGIVGALLIAARLEAKGSTMGANAASTCGVLIFAAGIALVGQMYHLPTDWPAGAFLIALGGLVVAVLLRSDGALIVAFIALSSWSGGRWIEQQGALHWPFFMLFLPAFWLALGRQSRFIHHVAVLSLAGWLALVPGDWVNGRFDYGLIAYGLAVSCVFVALGALALDRGLPPLATAFLPWGLVWLMVGLCIELVRILDTSLSGAGTSGTAIYLAYLAAAPAIAGLALLSREKRFAWPLAAALLLSLLIPVVFWSGGVVRLPGKVVVASLVLLIAIALVAAGAAGGVRRLTLAGSALFFVAVMILLWQTIGTLLDQSLFFLVGGAALLGMASLTRRLVARFAKASGEPA